MRARRRTAAISRRGRKMRAFVEVVKPEVVFVRSLRICGICKEYVLDNDKWHVDHIVPLALGGEHSYRNTQLAHAICNQRKGARLAVVGGG